MTESVQGAAAQLIAAAPSPPAPPGRNTAVLRAALENAGIALQLVQGAARAAESAAEITGRGGTVDLLV